MYGSVADYYRDLKNKGSYSAAVEEMLRSFRLSLKPDPDVDWKPGYKRYYDYTPYSESKRKEATISLLSEAKKRLNGVISEEQIEAYLAYSNMLIMRGGYNAAIDFLGDTTLCAAIWILDNLAIHDKIDQIYPLLPKITLDNMPDDLLLPPFHHPIYDIDLILSLQYLIKHRNTIKIPLERAEGSLVWEKEIADKNPEAQKNRKAYDCIISLLDQDDVRNATSKYEEDVWRFYRIAFAIYNRVEEEIIKWDKERDQLEHQLIPNISGLTELKKNPLLANPVTVQSNFSSGSVERSNIEEKIRLLESKIELYATTITFTDLSLVNDREKVLGKLKGIVPRNMGQELIAFHVDDPYESAFALLHLLDSGSLIPWLYYGSISVAYTMNDQMPLDSNAKFTSEPVLLSNWNDALYQHRYKGYRWEGRLNAEGEPVQRTYAKNLSQLFYESSQTLFPRVVPSQPLLDTYLESLGDLTDREKEAYSLLLFMLNSSSLGYDAIDPDDVDEEQPLQNVETPQKSLSFDQEAILSENERLHEKNKELTSLLRNLKQQKKTAESNVAVLKAELTEKAQELADLRELVFLLDNRDHQEEPIDETIQYPYITPGRIISFGGHPSWIKEMRKKLPSVVFVEPDALPNADLIRSADTIWIQTNYISHSNFYKIIHVVGASGKQLRYFTSTSSARCAEQVVKTFDKH